MFDLFADFLADTLHKPANDFLENFLFKNSDFYEVDENGEKALNEIGSKIYAFFLVSNIMGLVKSVNNALEDEEFIKQLETKFNIKIKK